jgi:hypothetical protein
MQWCWGDRMRARPPARKPVGGRPALPAGASRREDAVAQVGGSWTAWSVRAAADGPGPAPGGIVPAGAAAAAGAEGRAAAEEGGWAGMRARRIVVPPCSGGTPRRPGFGRGGGGDERGAWKAADPGVVKHVGPCGLPGAPDPLGSRKPRPGCPGTSGDFCPVRPRTPVRVPSGDPGFAGLWIVRPGRGLKLVLPGPHRSMGRTGPLGSDRASLTAPAPDPASRAFEVRSSKPQAPIPAPPSQRLATAPLGGRGRPHHSTA